MKSPKVFLSTNAFDKIPAPKDFVLDEKEPIPDGIMEVFVDIARHDYSSAKDMVRIALKNRGDIDVKIYSDS